MSIALFGGTKRQREIYAVKVPEYTFMLFMLLPLLGCGADSKGGGDKGSVRICTIPMRGIGMVPMTRERIEKSCLNIASLDASDPRVKLILSYMEVAEPSDFDGQEVRATISMPNRPKIYISRFGEMDSNGVKTKLSDQNFPRLIKIFEQLEAEWDARCEGKFGDPGCELGGAHTLSSSRLGRVQRHGARADDSWPRRMRHSFADRWEIPALLLQNCWLGYMMLKHSKNSSQ